VVKAIDCLVLPEGVSLKLGALAEPLAVAWHSIRTSSFQAGQTALVLGAGPIGLAILLLLRVWGASKIAVTEVTTQCTTQARKFGADVVVNPLKPASTNGATIDDSQDPVLSALEGFTGDGVDVAFDATGLQSTLTTGLAAIRLSGTFYNVAIHEKPLSLNLNGIACLEKKLLGGICYPHEDFEQVLAAMAAGEIPCEQMITAVVPLSNAVEGAFMELMNNKAEHVKILIQPDGP
jgi:(R,R)-butanediol dehydrogenase / meso-butanediol dehydrogenase / diacetyl reductase